MRNIHQNAVFTSPRMEQQWARIQGVKMIQHGFAVKDVADFFGVTPRAIFKWMAAFAQSGQNGLLAKDGAGRPPKINDEQMRWVAMAIRDNTPDQLKFQAGLWTPPLVRALIERELGLRLSQPTLLKLLALMGLSSRKPLQHLHEHGAATVEHWKKSALPALRQHAKNRGARILYADKCSLHDTYLNTTHKRRPHDQSKGARPLNMLSAIGGTGELRFMLTDHRDDVQAFKEFLRQLMLQAKQRIILVVDDPSIHNANTIKKHVAATDGMLELHMPSYSPLTPSRRSKRTASKGSKALIKE
jgi:transposase